MTRLSVAETPAERIAQNAARRVAKKNMIQERRDLAKQAVIEAVTDVWGEGNVPKGYVKNDIFATEHHSQNWGWWFYLTTKATPNIVFKVAYSYKRKSYQVVFFTREHLTEISKDRVDATL